jgi:cell division transport system permease protein
MRRIIYFLKTALENIQINKAMAFFSLISLSLTLMLFGLFLLFYYNVQSLLELIQEDVHFSIYLSDPVKEDVIGRIKEKLSADSRILSFEYISKEKALQLFHKEFQDDSLIKSLGGNPLPASFEVKVKAAHQELKKMVSIINPLKEIPGVEEVQYGADWLENLDRFLKVLGMIGVGIGGFLGVAVMTIISNTVRLHFYNRKEEIEIMRLIGATHHFIKIPFFMEGSFMGFLSGGVSVLMLFLIFHFSKMRLQSVGGGVLGGILELRFLPVEFLLGIVVAGGILGGIGGVISLTHLLRLRIPVDESGRN